MKKITSLVMGICFAMLANAAEVETKKVTDEPKEKTPLSAFAWCGLDIRGTTTCPDGTKMFYMHGRVVYNCETLAIRHDLTIISSVSPSEACQGHSETI